VVPVAVAVRAPVAEPIVATDVLALDQVPPAGLAESVVVVARHVADMPDMAPGVGCTVATVVVKQPVAVVV
jgi:hypothetical protein